MKVRVSFFWVLFLTNLFLIHGLPAQNGQELAEPKVNQFFFFVSPGQFKPLEEQTPAVPHQKSFLAIEGNRSRMRFVQGEPLVFVVRLASDDVDPAKAVQLIKLTSQGNYRVLERMGGGSKKMSYAGLVRFEAERYEESGFKIKPKGVLAAGDYALTVAGEKEVYCFGVDAAAKELK
jgi:preprotein translocase subunit Sec61beta